MLSAACKLWLCTTHMHAHTRDKAGGTDATLANNITLDMKRARPLLQPAMEQSASTACKVDWREPWRHLADVHSGVEGVPGVDHDVPAPHAHLPGQDIHLRGCVRLSTCMLRSRMIKSTASSTGQTLLGVVRTICERDHIGVRERKLRELGQRRKVRQLRELRKFTHCSNLCNRTWNWHDLTQCPDSPCFCQANTLQTLTSTSLAAEP